MTKLYLTTPTGFGITKASFTADGFEDGCETSDGKQSRGFGGR